MIWHNLDTFPHSNPCNIGITCFSYFWTEYFKHILYATVSKRPNQIAIIKKLFWDKDELVPEFRNEEDAVNQMELKPKRKAESGTILLVLDDVWCGSESLLTKFKFQISESKVLVTSRNEFPEFGSTYDLELLNDDDAMALFRHSAIPQNGSCNYTPTDRLVKKVVCHSIFNISHLHVYFIYMHSFVFSPNHKWFHLLVVLNCSLQTVRHCKRLPLVLEVLADHSMGSL